MLNLEISEAARDSILSIDWTDAAENRNLDGKRFVIALLWANPITKESGELVLGPVERSQVPEDRFLKCRGHLVDIVQLLPDELRPFDGDFIVDLTDDGLTLVRRTSRSEL